MKKCHHCKVEKSLNEFYANKTKKDKLTSWCRDCRYEGDKNGKLFAKYGITKKQYDVMFISQNGLCAICNQPETISKRRNGEIAALTVDHCHKTGQIRKLLCNSCNLVIGKIESRDNAFEINKVIEKYLNIDNYAMYLVWC
jgi:recombination endonuclease VII